VIDRRALINGTALGGALLASAPRDSAAGAAADVSDRQMEDVVRAIRTVHDEISRQATFWEIAGVREQFRTFLRANGKFPDFVDVGTDVWQQVYDWHVRFQQPITLGRTPDGRMTIVLMATTVVMRTDATPNYVSLGYDK
jgi:hypothetical protein